MDILRATLLFVATALAEIIGCYLSYLWLRQERSAWLLIPALAAFAWLLTQHRTAAGRDYATYGDVYITVALGWLWLVDGVRPQLSDAIGVALCLTRNGRHHVRIAGVASIASQRLANAFPRNAADVRSVARCASPHNLESTFSLTPTIDAEAVSAPIGWTFDRPPRKMFFSYC